jgi:hypothetical protein
LPAAESPVVSNSRQQQGPDFQQSHTSFAARYHFRACSDLATTVTVSDSDLPAAASPRKKRSAFSGRRFAQRPPLATDPRSLTVVYRDRRLSIEICAGFD